MAIQFRLSNLLQISAILIVLVLGLLGPAEGGDNWQEEMLFNPSASQQKIEKRGRVIIYDGLKDTQISQAMDTQFDRVQSMMFIRTVVTDSEGEIQRDKETNDKVVEDDGC